MRGSLLLACAIGALAGCSGEGSIAPTSAEAAEAAEAAETPDVERAGLGEGDDNATAGFIDVSAQGLASRIEQGEIRLIDVRTDAEVATGMIAGAEHIPLDDLDPQALAEGADGREVVFYCRSGRRSALAAEALAQHTGSSVRHLAGGIIAWEEAGGAIAAAPAK